MKINNYPEDLYDITNHGITLCDCRIKNAEIADGCKVYNHAKVIESVLHGFVSIGDDSTITNCELLRGVVIQRRCILSNSSIDTGSSVGNNSRLNNVHMGKYCPISWNVTIEGGNHPFDSLMMANHSLVFDEDNLGPGTDPVLNSPVIIGSDVWIGSGANIQIGVHIGDGAVIGANAVVTKDIPPYAIAVGVPAKVIKYRFSNDIIDDLLKIQWWNHSKDELLEYRKYFEGPLTREKVNILLNMIKK